MSLLVRKDPEKFAAIQKLAHDTLTPDYADRFLARSIRMIPVIRENARIFAAASAPVLGNQRAGIRSARCWPVLTPYSPT